MFISKQRFQKHNKYSKMGSTGTLKRATEFLPCSIIENLESLNFVSNWQHSLY